MWKTGGPAYDATVKTGARTWPPDDAIVGFLYLGTEAARGRRRAPREWRDLVRYCGRGLPYDARRASA